MGRSCLTISLAWTLVLLLGGCASTPLHVPAALVSASDPPTTDPHPAASKADGPRAPSTAAASTSQEPATKATAQSPHAPASQAPAAGPDPQELQALIAELQQLGALDPEAQQTLMEDLGKTDPAMWKPVRERFRAALAYRRRIEERKRDEREAPDPPTPGSHAVGMAVASSEQRAATEEEIVLGPKAPATAEAPPAADRAARHESAGAKTVRRLSPPNARPSAATSGATTAADDRKDHAPSRDEKAPPSDQAAEPSKKPDKDTETVVPASHTESMEPSWQDRLASAIRGMEAEASPSPKTDEEIARHAALRLMYLAAGRRDDAMRPIPGVPPAMQDFWSSEVFGLATLLDSRRTPDRRDRAAEAKRLLGEAAAKLSVAAPLVVKGLAFATEVQSFGCYTRFEKDEFAADQEVLLYAEVENFRSEPTPKGFQTTLRSSYKIYDSRGQQAAEEEFPVTEESCRSERRDFFIGYHLRIPKALHPGKYTLKLTIEDLKRNEVGQASIDFSVRAAKEQAGRPGS